MGSAFVNFSSISYQTLPAAYPWTLIVSTFFSAAFTSVACSHQRSYYYFAESLAREQCQFSAYPCDTYDDFTQGTCNVCGDTPCPVMGDDAILSKARRGNYYLITNSQNPFCSKCMLSGYITLQYSNKEDANNQNGEFNQRLMIIIIHFPLILNKFRHGEKLKIFPLATGKWSFPISK